MAGIDRAVTQLRPRGWPVLGRTCRSSATAENRPRLDIARHPIDHGTDIGKAHIALELAAGARVGRVLPSWPSGRWKKI